MKVLKYALPALAIAGSSSFIAPAAQAAEVSGNVALVTDYRFRGISQSDSKPSIQGGFDIAFDSGFYLGTWGAAVDFDCSSDPVNSCGGANGGLELDYYGGYSHTFAGGVGIDVGYIYYDYPQDEGVLGDYEEVYGNVSFGGFSAGFAYSDEYWLETGEILYLNAGYSLTLPGDWGLGFLVGQVDYDEVGYTLTDKHVHWAVSLSKSWQGIDWSLTYEDTDLSEEDCYGYDWCDATVIFGMAKSL